MIAYQEIFPFNHFPPIPDASIATIDMADLQRPPKERDSLTDSLQTNLLGMKRKIQTILEKLTYEYDAL